VSHWSECPCGTGLGPGFRRDDGVVGDGVERDGLRLTTAAWRQIPPATGMIRTSRRWEKRANLNGSDPLPKAQTPGIAQAP